MKIQQPCQPQLSASSFVVKMYSFRTAAGLRVAVRQDHSTTSTTRRSRFLFGSGSPADSRVGDGKAAAPRLLIKLWSNLFIPRRSNRVPIILLSSTYAPPRQQLRASTRKRSYLLAATLIRIAGPR